ncbi:MAG: twin-arginine translocation pathway signal protein, partial [Planctomycetota bacterium]|nr:twin-arginine translocation pathway signal protein [Planctomycetota bacterium]
DLLKDRPSVLVPDDHDVFHGNLWGAGGVRARAREGRSAQDSGGYRMPPAFVNAVHTSLTSHLPPSKVPPTIGAGITTYTTDFSWGGVDFAVLADRMWKDSPSVMVPEAEFRNGWIQAKGIRGPDTDRADAQLLGSDQEAFLGAWTRDRDPGTWTQVVLSQSPFGCLHSLPAETRSDTVVGRQKPPAPGQYPENDAPVADGDSNGWPQSARDRAVALLAEANALHLCGDQHLGTVSWYGGERWRDGTVAFTSPAMGNTWPRRWMPREAGARRPVDAHGQATTPRYTGDYLDGFGNRVTMLAVANPEENGREPMLQMNRAPGFGLVRFQPSEGGMVLEAWPTWDSPTMYPGWPVHVNSKGRPVGGGWDPR